MYIFCFTARIFIVYKKNRSVIKMLCFLFSFFISANAFSYVPKTGDLLFQDEDCGPLCNAISQVTTGYHNTQINHVALLVFLQDKPEVLEASGKQVHLTPLKLFLHRSLDNQQRPRVMVGRLKSPYQHLIPQAVQHALSWQGKPYNVGFTPNNNFKEFYCSQLVYDAFRLSNHGKPFFITHNMTFQTKGKTLIAWRNYFKHSQLPIPEGKKGTNPGMMSRSDKINIIYAYGRFRTVKQSV